MGMFTEEEKWINASQLKETKIEKIEDGLLDTKPPLFISARNLLNKMSTFWTSLSATRNIAFPFMSARLQET